MMSEFSKGSIQLVVVTPEEQVFAEAVDFVSVPGSEGELGILPGHCALMSLVKAGKVRLKRSGREDVIEIGEGFLEVTPGRVVLLVDRAVSDLIRRRRRSQ